MLETPKLLPVSPVKGEIMQLLAKRMGITLLLGTCVATAVCANLVANPGFEVEGDAPEQARHWNDDTEGGTWGGTVRSDWQSYRGQHAAALRGAWSGMDYAGLWQSCPVVGGARYRFSVRLMWDNEWAAQSVKLRVEWYNKDQKISQDEQVLTHLPENDWQERFLSAKAPLEASRAHIVVDASGIDQEGVLYLDEIRFEEN
jgi:hypothetical protein